MNKYQEKLERVAEIAGEITDVVASSGVVRLALACKHGNYATAPYNHAWFCDDCWLEMVEAIQELRAFQLGLHSDAGESAALERESTPEVLPTSQADSQPAPCG